MTGFSEIVNKTVEFIMANREKLVEAFIAETGLMPSNCKIVEQIDPGGKRIVFMMKTKQDGDNVLQCEIDALTARVAELEGALKKIEQLAKPPENAN